MTTDKLPDVVWMQFAYDAPDYTGQWLVNTYAHDVCENDGTSVTTPYIRKSALAAMTAERDALKLDRVKWRKTLMDERDSAREALAKATELLRLHEWGNADDFDRMCNSCGRHRIDGHNAVCSIAEFLAAQPETKP